MYVLLSCHLGWMNRRRFCIMFCLKTNKVWTADFSGKSESNQPRLWNRALASKKHYSHHRGNGALGNAVILAFVCLSVCPVCYSSSETVRFRAMVRNVRRILVRGVNAPLPPEAKKNWKFWKFLLWSISEQICGQHSAVLYTCLPWLLSKYSINIENCSFFACFRFLIFHPFFRGRSADPICPYVRTPMAMVRPTLEH